MKLVALMPVRNEEWILRLSLRVALSWCDAVVVLDHASDDATPSIIRELGREFPGRVVNLHTPDPCWAEMEHRQHLLDSGRRAGGTHFALVDADEIITANLRPFIRKMVGDLLPAQALDVPMVPVWGDLEHYRSDDCIWSRSMLTLAFADAPELHWVNAEDGYAHHHRAPYGIDLRIPKHTPGVMHLQFADMHRLRAKHALYKMQELLRWPGREPVADVDATYSQALDETGMKRSPCRDEWWAGYDKSLITLGGIAWQEAETRRLYEQHGAETFDGLELWGFGKSV